MTKDTSKQEFKPSDYLRQRRPERYSDSEVLDEPQITRDLLEYHLDSLTSRSQEKEFEHFARRLAEKELCPNLLPQTGPTGGGDSKVDSETYPVADEIALRWYQGNASATERWAFAISAKKDWRPKVRSDVKGIAETERGYSLIYFITNQFVRDKARAEVEDSLKQEFGIEVRILDRQWITTAVLEHGREDLAISLLSIEGLQVVSRKSLGPRDAKREVELAELDAEISDPDRYAGVSFQLAEDCLSGAILASELERDRNEVDGRFQAALRVAKQVGDSRQILRIIYKHAWVSLFLYDDVATLSELYDEVEEIALESTFADDISWLHNLWNALFGSIGIDDDLIEKYGLLKRGEALEARLQELSLDDARPNNSLHARTILSLHRLTLSRLSGGAALTFDDTCKELEEILVESKGLGQYPFESFKEIAFELGEIAGGSDAYNSLFDTVVGMVEERSSEGGAGSALVHRGIQEVRQGRTYEAIRFFGRAQRKLVKDEYQDELVRCLIALGGAYRSAGLFWAARSSLLAGLSICIANFNSQGYMHRLALLAAKGLAWLEISLGRVPNVLFSLILVNFIANNIDQTEEDQDAYWESIQHLDAVLSMLLLRLDIDQLRTLGKLPYLLEKLFLVCAEGSLLFAFGQLGKLREDVWFEEEADDEEIEDFYNLICHQPANDDLPLSPELYSNEISKLESGVLGLTLTVDVDSNQTSILIAESLLGALEAFLATSLSGGIMPYKQIARVAIRVGDARTIKSEFGIELVVDEDGYDVIVIHRQDFSLQSGNSILNFRDFATQFIAGLLPRIAIYDDEQKHIERLAEEEDVFGRSTLFSDLMTLSENVFGSLDWLDVEKLVDDISKEPYDVIRRRQWVPERKARAAQEDLKPGTGDAPEHIADTEGLRHGERKVLSLINVPIWDRATWRGAAFMIFPEGQFPPTIGLLFENEEAARQIFEDWIERLGKADEKEELRISIITGIDKDNPTYYRMQITTNINAYERSGDQGQFVMTARIQTMEPNSSENLEMFLEEYRKVGVFALLPAVFKGAGQEPELIRDLFLFKTKLIVKPAWEISANDEDTMALQLDDNPIIPDGVEDAPVKEALEQKRKILNLRKSRRPK